MKRTALLLCLVGVLSFAAGPAAAQTASLDPCGLAGSWMVDLGVEHMLATYTTPNFGLSGASDLESYNADPTLGGMFSSAVALTSGRGAWVRTGIRTYAYTFVMVATAADRSTVYQMKVSGVKTLARNCTTMEFTINLEFYAATQDPLGSAPPLYGATSMPNGTAKRIRVPEGD